MAVEVALAATKAVAVNPQGKAEAAELIQKTLDAWPLNHVVLLDPLRSVQISSVLFCRVCALVARIQ